MENYFESIASGHDQSTNSMPTIASSDIVNDEYNIAGYRMVDDVRIIPEKLLFNDAYDGKIFKRSFSIVNYGKYPAFVRVMPPGSKIFQMKAVRKGVKLSAGLSLTRTISYTHKSAMVLPQAYMFIYINEKQISYQIEVLLVSPLVSLTPSTLDFGEIDVGNSSKQMTIKLRNKGRKYAPFLVDLGRNDLELIVEPMKGAIEPNNTVDMTLEVISSQMGSFNKEFWIKTEPPQRVKIHGIFIQPKLILEYPLSKFDLKMIDFPKTYYGAKSKRTLVLRNRSSTSTMYCTVAELGNNYCDYLHTVRETNDNLKLFFITPKEGRLQAQEKYILQYSFEPRKMRTFPKKYAIALIKIIKVNYRDGCVVEKDVAAKTFPSTTQLEVFSVASLRSIQDNFQSVKNVTPEDSYIRICLYGEMEEASVKLTPAVVCKNYLKLHETHECELDIKNNSNYLPIIVRYIKEVYIEVEPREVHLPPNHNKEVKLIIRPSKVGEICSKIKFELIYHSVQQEEYYKVGTTCLVVQYFTSMAPPKIEPKFNMGITPMLTNEVGYFVDDIRFNTNISKPRQAIVNKHFKSFNNNNNARIAFPNDRPKSLRPWKNTVPTCTIFANIPRIAAGFDDYVLNTTECEVKQFTRDVYSRYVQSRVKARQKKLSPGYVKPDYITNQKHLLLDEMASHKHVINKPIFDYSRFIPLPPEILMRVIIIPKYIQLGEIAPYTACSDCFIIENKNEFPITVSIRALNNSIVIKEKKTMIIEGKKMKNICFNCFSCGLGKYYVPVFIVINNYHVFDATVFARVIPTTVKCCLDEIIIDPRTNECLFEIYNPVNCDITFCWEVQDNNFDILPKSGIIPPRKAIFCRIMFLPQVGALFNTDIYLISQNGAKQVIRVSLKHLQPSIGFDTQLVKLDNTPLNISIRKKLVLRNFSDEKIMYVILNPNPIEEITVKPTTGEIYGKSDMCFIITAHFKSVVEFNCCIKFVVQDIYRHNVNIEGSVVYPCIKLEPCYIQLQKITSGAHIRRLFRITNISEVQTLIQFPLGDTPEICIKDMDKNYVKNVITLESNESRKLFLEFKPTEPVAYSIFLPYIINGIIGPPVCNEPTSLKPITYFERNIENDSIFKFPVKLPETLITMNIRCAAGPPWLKFSSLQLYLYAFDNRRVEYFTIKNISTMQHRIRIPMVEPEYPFNFELEKASNYEKKDFYKVIIEPGEVVTFKIEFNPSEYGYYDIDLPIFVEKYSENCLFNFLNLSGSNPKPIISCKHSLCLSSIFVEETISENIVLNLVSHKDNCEIITTISNEALSIKILEKQVLTSYSKIICLVTFDPEEECFVDHEIIFSCTCCSESSCTLFVKACADNSSYVSYQSLYKYQALIWSQKVTSTFPYFPEISDDSFYANNMRVLLETLEKWIFTQGFFFKNFYKIPSGIECFPVNIDRNLSNKKKTSKKSETTLPLIQLLINLTDASIFKYINESNLIPSFEGIEGTIYVYTVYTNTISFLKSQGIFVPQLEPEYLLPYDNYVIFKERLTSDETRHKEILLTEDKFYLFSKQCWIDILLRIYKVYVFKRIMIPATLIYRGKSKIPPKYDIYREELTQYFSENMKYITNHSENEAKLLLWLEFHFEKQKFVLWNSESIKQPRKFRSFHNHMWDSLPFATLMLSYCPYMLHHLNNFYPELQSEEQIFHNACLILECWRKIHLSFDIAPSCIVKPTTAQMIFLTAYLYEVLPNFYPTETITLEASLGDIAVNEISLRNHGNATISYTAIFFSNDSDIFQVESKTITIPPKKEKKIKITYVAKNIETKTSVLVLSGETAGHKFSRSMAITLIGIPSVFKFCAEFDVNVDTYERVRKRLTISSPYEKAYVANVSFYFDGESYFESVHQFVPASTLDLVPIQINIDSMVTFDEDGETVFKINLCYLVTGCFTYFVYFVNEEIGDFCIKVTVTSVLNPDQTLKAEVILPAYFDPSIHCMCQNYENFKGELKLNCPRAFTVEIPCRNSQLIDGLRSMLEYFCDEDEFSFWKALLEYPKGLHVLRNYIRNTFDERIIKYGNALKPIVIYDLQTSPHISGPGKITLDNVSTDDTHMITLHWNGDSIPENELLVLTAEHGQEMRQYMLTFIVPKEVQEDIEYR